MSAAHPKMTLSKLAAIILFALLMPLLASAAAPVTISESDTAYTLDNGILSIIVSKHSGNVTSLTYHGLQMLDTPSRQPGYWEHDAARGQHQIDQITIDPHSNGGKRAEVSVRGISGGTPMGGGPGGFVVADVEIRYMLAQGDSAVYAYEKIGRA